MLSEVEVAKELLKINAIRLQPEDPFIWASGMKSPIYCDNRLTLSYPETRSAIKRTLALKASDLWQFSKIAGVATAGIAHGALIADFLNLPFIYIRSKAKEHGAKNQIEGNLEPGDKCLVVEDLISTGRSSIQAVKVIRAAGGLVCGVVAIFTYELQKAQENFESIQCPYTTISNYSALMEAAIQSASLSDKQLTSLKNWRENPEQWSHNFN